MAIRQILAWLLLLTVTIYICSMIACIAYRYILYYTGKKTPSIMLSYLGGVLYSSQTLSVEMQTMLLIL